ncbi:MAG: FAD-dependent oxidoreductase [Pigmentiphaga sp.]
MTSTSASTDGAPIVIIGAGQAGASAARALRDAGYTGALMMLGEELHWPYERPPLSKDALNQPDPKPAFLLNDELARTLGITVRTQCRVSAIDANARRLLLDDGSQQPYHACLIATGGNVRSLPGLPLGAPGVHYLRTLDDAQRLRAALADTDHLLIIGGGFLGLEVASTARALGRRVTLLENANALLKRALPARLSDWLAARARAYGVDLRLNAVIEQVTSTASGVTVKLQHAETLSAPQVLVAIGQTPQTALAAQTGLALDPVNGGILVDAHGKTSLEGLYAAGDCSSRPDPRSGHQQRLESWQNANEQGRCAAQAMLGLPVAPLAEPWFWTDLFDCNVQIMGQNANDLQYVVRGELPEGQTPAKALVFGLRNGELAHLIAINAGGELRPFRALIGQPLACPADVLADTSIPAKQLARLAAGPVNA